MGGCDKGLLRVAGRRIVDRQLAVLRPLFGEVLLVADAATLERHTDVEGVRPVLDRQPGRGPLAGLEAALSASSAEAVLVLGCDLPLLDEGLLTLVRDHRPAAEAVVPRLGGRAQALHARYIRAVLPAVQAQLAANQLRLLALLDAIETEFLDEAVLRSAARDGGLSGLTNVNTPADLAAAEDDALRSGR
jgi:molybdopterin-guanine dinucleotide biosynthesis protein A